ncbi:virulence RhuM family protein, partial [Patescibacteria group bacterium]|nr:virulence RhuM family protein [Patescibacteria group bacterium]
MTDQSIQESDFLLYTSPDGSVNVDVLIQDETVWLTQEQMAELFGKSKSTINEHIGNIYSEVELVETDTMRKSGNSELSTKPTNYYNLDVIISVGYRVKSQRGTQFRIWATRTLREYIIKGFVLSEERLKGGSKFGKDYFEELLEKIREIRASERRFYQKITDIFAQCSVDYDSQSEITRTFFSTVQNKLEWAIIGKTAAEIITERVDSNKPNMGLTTWKNSPEGKVLKGDVAVAKNYLNQEELSNLNRIVTMYLDFAELQASRHVPVKMTDWVVKLDAFLQFNEYEILKDTGSVSAEVAKALAEKEYESFRIEQDKEFESDFDRETSQLVERMNNDG